MWFCACVFCSYFHSFCVRFLRFVEKAVKKRRTWRKNKNKREVVNRTNASPLGLLFCLREDTIVGTPLDFFFLLWPFSVALLFHLPFRSAFCSLPLLQYQGVRIGANIP